jgi:O-antigen/teichoic acid export membrane protein
VKIPLPHWIKKNSDILFNTSSLIVTMLVTSGLGSAYWGIAARFYPTEAVGLASAATSSLMLLSTLLLLGQGTLLITELPRNKGKEGSLICASLLLVGCSSFLVGSMYALFAPFISPQLRMLGVSPLNVFIFGAGVSLAAITFVLDQALIGLLRGGVQLWRNTVFSVGKLVFLVIAAQYFAQNTGISIYAMWALGNLISLLPVLIFLAIKKKLSLKYYKPEWTMMRRLGRASIQHHGLNLVLQAPTQLLPLMVTVLLSAKMNAWFYIASMIATFIFSLTLSLTAVLHATNAAQITTLTQKTRLTFSLALASSVSMGVVIVFLANPILSVFGESYAANAAWSLRILMMATVPLVVKNHFIAICRIKDNIGGVIIPVSCGSLLELVLAGVGAQLGGLNGLSLGWVAALVIEAVFMAPAVWKVLFDRHRVIPYFDELALADTMLLPALGQMSQTGGMELTTLGNTMTLSELDTIQVPAVWQYRASTQLPAIQRANSQSSVHAALAKKRDEDIQVPEDIANIRTADLSPLPVMQNASRFLSPLQETMADAPTRAFRLADLGKDRAYSESIEQYQTIAMAPVESPTLVRGRGQLPDKSPTVRLAAPDPIQEASLEIADTPTIISPSFKRPSKDDDEPVQEPKKLDIVFDLVLLVIPIVVLVIWCFSLKGIDVRQMNDLGLISVFSPATVGSLVVLTVCFCLIIRCPRHRYPVLILYFGLLIFMLYGVTNLIEEMPRFAVFYRHAGYTEFITRTGTADPNLDAYFSWPGFFSLNAFIVIIAGYADTIGYGAWTPVVYNVMYFAPLYMIFTSFTKNRRIVWLALWLFYLTNWIGQDYFSPQGFYFFLYLVIIGILVKWFKSEPGSKPIFLKPFCQKIPLIGRLYPWLVAYDPLRTPVTTRQRWALIATILIIFVFTVASHQLTPFFTILAVAALVVTNRIRLWWLPVFMGVLTVVWVLFMAKTFMAGHSSMVFSGIKIFSSFSENVTSRVAGNPEHMLVAKLRVYTSVFIWGSAFLCGVIRARRGYKDATLVLLALSPFPLFVAQPYGGEMILRTYLFALPATVFFIASFLYSVPIFNRSYIRTAVSICLCLLLLGGFFFTRYGNENMDYMTKDEMDGITYLYNQAHAPSRSLLLSAWANDPVQYKDYEKFAILDVDSAVPGLFDTLDEQGLDPIEEFMQTHTEKTNSHAYLIFSRTGTASFNSMSGLEPGSLNMLKQKVEASKNFKPIFVNRDIQIFQFVGNNGGGR